MLQHHLTKTESKEWFCETCRQTWRGKPRSECPGVVVYGVKTFVGVPPHLKSTLDLTAKNLKPKGEPLGCVLDSKAIHWLYDEADTEVLHNLPIVKQYSSERDALKTATQLQFENRTIKGAAPQAMMWTGQWEFLYWAEDCAIANPHLPTIYTWSDRPDHLETPHNLQKFNLKPSNAQPKGCVWDQRNNQWVFLYNPDDEGFEILDPTLPRCYRKECIPPELKSKGQLKLLNLKLNDEAQPKGCYRKWEKQSTYEWDLITINLYHTEDCQIVDPSLPTCYPENGYPAELKTVEELEELNLAPGETQPRGCYRRTWYGELQTILLYHPDDCQWQPKDRYIAKTTLRRTYLLSDRWIKRLGEPDQIRDNPHHEKWSAMLLYSRQRVEQFLAENAEEYAQWLSERDRYLAIFEQNREAIQAGRERARSARRQARQAELERLIAESEAERLEWQLRQEQLRAEHEARWQADLPRRQQMIQCLRCASGCAMPGGFLCAIHPKGLEDWQIPCVDWTAKA